MNPSNLTGQTVLITGMGSEIAQAIASEILQAGNIVLGQYRERCPEINGIEYIQANLQTAEDCKTLINKTKPNILINCIGDFHFGELAELTPEKFEQIIYSNLNLAYTLTHYATHAGASQIIHLGYGLVEEANIKSAILPYHIAKNGLTMMVRAFAKEYTKLQINAISPIITESNNYPVSESLKNIQPVSNIKIAQLVIETLQSEKSGENIIVK